MWKHIGAATIVLSLSGCTGDRPTSADITQAQASIANFESAADAASCPTTALQIHMWAGRAREAIRLNDAGRLTIAQNALLLGVAACKNEKENSQRFASAAFDPAELGQFTHRSVI